MQKQQEHDNFHYRIPAVCFFLFYPTFSNRHQEYPDTFSPIRTNCIHKILSTPCCISAPFEHFRYTKKSIVRDRSIKIVNIPNFKHFRLEERIVDRGFRTLLGYLSFPAGFLVSPESRESPGCSEVSLFFTSPLFHSYPAFSFGK